MGQKKPQVVKNTCFLHSFIHALEGIGTIYQDERNMRYHTLIGLLPLASAWYFQVSMIEWLLIIFCIFFVLLMEFVNTIVENIVDLIVDYEYHILAKKAKDIAAGAVLLTAIFAVIVASCIFLPRIFAKF